MKRVFFVTLAAVMMLAACKKDVEKLQPRAFDPYDDRAVEARIKEFNQKIQQNL